MAPHLTRNSNYCLLLKTEFDGIYINASSTKLRNAKFVIKRKFENVTGILSSDICNLNNTPFRFVPCSTTAKKNHRKKTNQKIVSGYLWEDRYEQGGLAHVLNLRGKRKHEAKIYGDSLLISMIEIKTIFCDKNTSKINFYVTHNFLDDNDGKFGDKSVYKARHTKAMEFMDSLFQEFVGLCHAEIYAILSLLIHANGVNMLDINNFVNPPRIRTTFKTRNIMVQCGDGYEKADDDYLKDEDCIYLNDICGSKLCFV